MSPKVTKYLGYFCKKICHPKPKKFAQFGHTAKSRRNERCEKRATENDLQSTLGQLDAKAFWMY